MYVRVDILQGGEEGGGGDPASSLSAFVIKHPSLSQLGLSCYSSK